MSSKNKVNNFFPLKVCQTLSPGLYSQYTWRLDQPGQTEVNQSSKQDTKISYCIYLNIKYNFNIYRVPGVLQRFGICYFVVFLVGYAFTPAQPKSYNNTFMSNIQGQDHFMRMRIADQQKINTSSLTSCLKEHCKCANSVVSQKFSER